MVQHLQQKLHLDSSFLEDLSCLNPVHKGKDWILNPIGCISFTIPHVVKIILAKMPLNSLKKEIWARK